MTDWYAPNQQAVGTEPAAGGGGGTQAATASSSGFDPGEHTVDEVKAHVDANPDQAQAVLDAELAGKNRTTLVDWLTGE